MQRNPLDLIGLISRLLFSTVSLAFQQVRVSFFSSAAIIFLDCGRVRDDSQFPTAPGGLARVALRVCYPHSHTPYSCVSDPFDFADVIMISSFSVQCYYVFLTCVVKMHQVFLLQMSRPYSQVKRFS